MSGMHGGQRPRSGRLALVTAIVIASLVAGCSLLQPSPSGSTSPGPSTAAASPSASETTPSTAPTVAAAAPARWTNCATTFQCATLRLPRDYHDPAAGTLDVAIIRLPATDKSQRIGSLIINPGGPGGSGIDLVQKSGEAFPSSIRKRFDLVGLRSARREWEQPRPLHRRSRRPRPSWIPRPTTRRSSTTSSSRRRSTPMPARSATPRCCRTCPPAPSWTTSTRSGRRSATTSSPTSASRTAR